MDINLLIESIIGLFIVLLILVFLVILPARKKKKAKEEAARKAKEQQQKKEPTIYDVEDFDTLRAKVRKTSLSKEELQETIKLIIKYYSKIPNKLGIRNHPDFNKYVDLMIHLARHPQTDKYLILELDKALHKANPQYKAELNELLSKALNARVPTKKSE